MTFKLTKNMLNTIYTTKRGNSMKVMVPGRLLPALIRLTLRQLLDLTMSDKFWLWRRVSHNEMAIEMADMTKMHVA